MINMKSNKTRRVNRKYDEERIKLIPKNIKQQLESLLLLYKKVKVLLLECLKKGIIRSHTNSIKLSIMT